MSNILVFDSGVGGISVVREIKQLLPNVSIDYLFDNLFYPYGELDEESLINRLSSLLSVLVEKTDPQLIVIACNSASTIALPALRKLFDIPIVGVVPAIKPASALSKSKVIGLLATQGTVTRDYIDDLAQTHAANCQLVSVGSNELVEMAEQTFRGITPNAKRLAQICDPIFEKADVMILGCTHFPLLIQTLKQVCPHHIVLIDSGYAIAQRVMELLSVINSEHKKTPDNTLNYRAFHTKANLDKLLFSSLFTEGFNEVELVTLQRD